MKIWLINPRTEGMISTELPGYVSREVGHFPPLGLLYLASYIRANSAHEVRVIDMPAQKVSYEDLSRDLKREKPEVVGITAITHNLVDVKRVADGVKSASPDTRVCLGGPHVDAFPEECLSISSLDIAIRGEGERSFFAFVEAVAGGKGCDGIPGLIRRDDRQTKANPPAGLADDLDELPYPARDLLDPGPYFYVLRKRSSFTTIVTTRGCPFHCIFCSTPHGRCRTRSAKNVVGEIEACLGSGSEEFHFIDDTFNIRPGRVEEVSEEILRRNLKIQWSFRGRVDTLGPESLKIARRSGCVRVHFGVETGTNEGLKLLRKQITTEEVERAMALSREAGISTVAYFLIGCPHERTREDVMRTVRFACRIRPDFVMFNVLAIYPHTELMDMAVERGLVERDLWMGFVRSPTPDFQLRFWDEFFTREELADMLRVAYRKFYMRPSVIWRNLRQLASFEELRYKSAAAIGLLRGRNS